MRAVVATHNGAEHAGCGPLLFGYSEDIVAFVPSVHGVADQCNAGKVGFEPPAAEKRSAS